MVPRGQKVNISNPQSSKNDPEKIPRTQDFGAPEFQKRPRNDPRNLRFWGSRGLPKSLKGGLGHGKKKNIDKLIRACFTLGGAPWHPLCGLNNVKNIDVVSDVGSMLANRFFCCILDPPFSKKSTFQNTLYKHMCLIDVASQRGPRGD